jgi:molybdenum cofactor cytidylyltransferase
MPEANKLLLPVGGRPIVRHVVESLLDVVDGSVLVVLGWDGDAVLTALRGLPVTPVLNPDHALGMGTSVAAGVTAAPEGAAFLLCVGDLPFLRPGHVNAVVRAFEAGGGQDPVVPAYEGRPGHPVAIPARYRKRLQSLAGDVGARAVLSDERRVEIPVTDPGILRDVDTPADFEGAAARTQEPDVSTLDRSAGLEDAG